LVVVVGGGVKWIVRACEIKLHQTSTTETRNDFPTPDGCATKKQQQTTEAKPS